MRTLATMLAYEAKRRPAVAALVERVHEMTEEEIDASSVPLPWFRIALKELRRDRLTVIMAAQMETAIRDDVLPDNLGAMWQWTRPEDIWITVARGGELLLREGQHYWFPKGGGVWIENLYSPVVDPRLFSGTHKGDVTRLAYIDAYKAHALANCPLDAPILIDQTPKTGLGRLGTLGVSFF